MIAWCGTVSYYSSPGLLRAIPGPTLFHNPGLKRCSGHAIHFAGGDNLEHCRKRGLRESDRPFLLCLDYKQVRGVEGARGLHIYAMPPSILVRHRHGTPAHRKSV